MGTPIVEGLVMRRTVVSFAFLLSSIHATVEAAAQARFADLAERAVVIAPEALPEALSVLLADCTTSVSATAKRACEADRRRRGRAEARAMYLVELPARDNVTFGPYETGGGGFPVYVAGFVLRRPDGPGVLATAPTFAGALPGGHVAASGFSVVPEELAEGWLATNTPENLRMRVLVRVGADFDDTSAPEPESRYGVRLSVVGVQLYSETTGSVLVDTLEPRSSAAPERLESRVRLWSHTERREALFVSNEGAQSVLSVRLLPREPGVTSTTALLMQTFGATAIEITRVTAPCCSSSIDVKRHGPARILAIVTEQTSDPRSVARGRVLLLAWDAATRTFEPRAEWVGANDAVPPAWALDPSVEP